MIFFFKELSFFEGFTSIIQWITVPVNQLPSLVCYEGQLCGAMIIKLAQCKIYQI